MNLILLAALPLALIGAYCLVQARRSLGPYAQVLRRPTRSISSLEAGAVEVAGTFHARAEPLVTLNGMRAVAVHTTVSYTYRLNGRTCVSGVALDVVDFVETEIRDTTGVCRIDATSAMLLGVLTSHRFAPNPLSAAYPELWNRIPFGAGHEVMHVAIDQTVVADGATGMISGQAREEGVAADGDYRGAHASYAVGGDDDRPLILAGFGESEVRRVLLRPAWMLGVLAALALAGSGTLVAAALIVGD